MFMSVSSGFSDEMAGLAATHDYVQDLSGNAQQVAMNEAKVGTEQSCFRRWYGRYCCTFSFIILLDIWL